MTQPFQITIDMREIEQFGAALGLAPQFVAEDAQLSMRKSLDVLEAAIAPRTPVGATGNLRGSIADEIRGDGANLHGEIFTPLVYGLPVEHGRRPGKMPPVHAIALWVYRKLDIGGWEGISVAYLIARKIAAKGTKGAHMFEEGFKDSQQTIVNIWHYLPQRVFDRIRRAM